MPKLCLGTKFLAMAWAMAHHAMHHLAPLRKLRTQPPVYISHTAMWPVHAHAPVGPVGPVGSLEEAVVVHGQAGGLAARNRAGEAAVRALHVLSARHGDLGCEHLGHCPSQKTPKRAIKPCTPTQKHHRKLICSKKC